jgi:uncharacterized 2Fe-2S/4Fe-4S cluster protein (DUF4445 family)
MSKAIKYHSVTFLPEKKSIKVEHLKTIFETILENNPQNIRLRFACGAEGICQKCKIRAFQKMGPMTPTEKGCLSREEIDKGIRLACQARVIQDTDAEIIYKMPFSIELMDEALSEDEDLRPRVEKIYVKARANDSLSEGTFIEAISESGINAVDLQKFSNTVKTKFCNFFKKNNPDCTAVFIDNELICLEEGNTKDQKFAAAVDIGINTLVVSLLDLNTGKKIAVVTDTNPQMELGADLKSRINMVAQDPMNLEILNEEILLRIDILILELCRARNLSPMHVYEIVVSGTTGMLHLFLKGVPGLMEQQTCLDTGNRGAFSADQLDFRSPGRAKIYSLPVISSYVGADITAGILATRLHLCRETVLFLDLGTASKAVLLHKGEIFATSVHDGGAFEGAGTGFGMRPETGAIKGVKMDEDDIHLSVIGQSLPRGICGSGLLELAAELKRNGIIDERGCFNDPDTFSGIASAVSDRVMDVSGCKAFLLYRDEGEFQTDIYVIQEDFSLLLKAKASVTAMVKKLVESAGIPFSHIARVLIGGAFGQRIDAETFIELGFVPLSLRGRIAFVGNTSKKGSQMVLLDRNILEEAEKLAGRVICIPCLNEAHLEKELNFLPDF